MEVNSADVRAIIEDQLDQGQTNFIIFPFGDVGAEIKAILNHTYGIQEKFIIDNHLCKYNKNIQPIDILEHIECSRYCVILASTRISIYGKLKALLEKYFDASQILELKCNKAGQIECFQGVDINTGEKVETRVGKYSYGPLIPQGYSELIESIGNFCGFAVGSAVVPNHPTNYITTHPMVYSCSPNVDRPQTVKYCEMGGRPVLTGIYPKGYIKKSARSRIGNDVWLGRNVIVCNGANIGNGVIAAAGAVITKDIPDYAVVAGVPARIIRYRYEPEQIKALNRIAWWDWTDEEIRSRHDDFYLSAEEFIKKYDPCYSER